MSVFIPVFHQFVLIWSHQIEDEGKKTNFNIQRAFYDRKVTKATFAGN